MANKVTFDFKSNPALRDAFAQKRPGDKCKGTLSFQVDEITEEGLVGTLEEFKPDGYKPNTAQSSADVDKDGTVRPNAVTEPVMLVVAGKRNKSKGY